MSINIFFISILYQTWGGGGIFVNFKKNKCINYSTNFLDLEKNPIYPSLKLFGINMIEKSQRNGW